LSVCSGLIVDRKKLEEAQNACDAIAALATLKEAFTTDVSILAATGERSGGAIDPISVYRTSGYRKIKDKERPASISAGIVDRLINASIAIDERSTLIAVDLAGSGRVFLAAFDEDEFLLDEVQISLSALFRQSVLRWNQSIFDEIKSGLRLAGMRALLGRSITSIGVDSWGVITVLLVQTASLLEIICYRDSRTDGAMVRIFSLVRVMKFSTRQAFSFKFNTLYQLFRSRERVDASADTRPYKLLVNR
jgi:hypothetical protein